jgi:hypothetical protein
MSKHIAAVRAFALANYNVDGWDILIETWDDDNIANAIGKARSESGAIDNVRKSLLVLNEVRQEAQAEAKEQSPEAIALALALAEAETAVADIDADSIVSASVSAIEASVLLPLAAATAVAGKAAMEEGKAKGASALAVMIAGFSSDAFAQREWAFDIIVKNQVHHHAKTTGASDMWNESIYWMLNGEGKVSRDAQSAYKLAFLEEFLGLRQLNASVWTSAKSAVQTANAIRHEGMAVTIEKGKLVLTGGDSDKAKAMAAAAAKSLAALTKAANDKTGTSRATPQNSKGGEGKGGEGGEGGAEMRPATAEEILRNAMWIAQAVAKGEEALGGAELSFIRAIAKAVNDNPAAFAED